MGKTIRANKKYGYSVSKSWHADKQLKTMMRERMHAAIERRKRLKKRDAEYAAAFPELVKREHATWRPKTDPFAVANY